MMFQDDIFDEWLESESKTVLSKFKTNEPLSIEDKMILTLKAQTNHFYHLDQDIRKDIAELDSKTMNVIAETKKDIANLESKTMNIVAEIKKDIASLESKTMVIVGELRKDTDKRFEQVDKRFEKVDIELKNIYKAINNQTWRMIGAIGLIVILSKLVESLPLIKF